MRTHLSPAESALWEAIRARQLGVVFRRQVVVAARFIADFFAPSARLIVEVDGRQHEQRRAADARRDRALRRAGYRVLRLPAELIQRDLPGALARIREALRQGAAP
jgi:very-short-patch-repair endonuclease